MIEQIHKKDISKLNDTSKAAKKFDVVFSATEWAQLGEIIQILKPFQYYTDRLQGDQVWCTKAKNYS